MATLTSEERKKYLDSMTPEELQSYTIPNIANRVLSSIGNGAERALSSLAGQGTPIDPTAPVPPEIDPRLLVSNKDNSISSQPTMAISNIPPSYSGPRNDTLGKLSPSLSTSDLNQPVVADLQSRPDLMKMTLPQLKSSVDPSGTPSINGIPIGNQQTNPQQTNPQVWTKNQNGSYTGNNTDVSFDSSVPQSAKDAFLAVPNTAPGATWEDMNRQRMGPAASDAWRFQGGSSGSSGAQTVDKPDYITVDQAREQGIGRKLLASLNDRAEKDYQVRLAAAGQENSVAAQRDIANNRNALEASTLGQRLSAEQQMAKEKNANYLAGISLDKSTINPLQQAQADQGNYIKVRKEVPFGEPDVTGKQQFTTEEQLYDRKLGQFIDGPKAQTFATPQPATVDKLLKMRVSKDPNLSAAEAEYKTRFGKLPY